MLTQTSRKGCLPLGSLPHSSDAHLHLVDIGGVQAPAAVGDYGLAAAVGDPAALGLLGQNEGTELPVS